MYIVVQYSTVVNERTKGRKEGIVLENAGGRKGPQLNTTKKEEEEVLQAFLSFDAAVSVSVSPLFKCMVLCTVHVSRVSYTAHYASLGMFHSASAERRRPRTKEIEPYSPLNGLHAHESQRPGPGKTSSEGCRLWSNIYWLSTTVCSKILGHKYKT